MARSTAKQSPLTASEIRALPAMVPLWPTAARAFNIGRSAAYELVAAGEFPVRVHRFGRAYRCATAEIMDVLGIAEVATSNAAEPAAIPA